MGDLEEYRYFLKDSIRKVIDFRKSDQSRGVPMPPEEEKVNPDLPRISLPGPEEWRQFVKNTDLVDIIGGRQSRRRFSGASLSPQELAFLLWATQGQRSPGDQPSCKRTVPSAGARHSFETYLLVNRVEKVSSGLYRFLPMSNELAFLKSVDRMEDTISKAVFGQRFVAKSAVVFVWATLPYRMEWRYLEAAHRVILLDAGHVCQNLYLGCEAIGAGTCAIAAYDQEAMDQLIQVDGKEQFTLYLAPVGKY